MRTQPTTEHHEQADGEGIQPDVEDGEDPSALDCGV